MRACIENRSDDGSKSGSNGAAAAHVAQPIATTGEVFADGSLIELIGSDENGNPQLMLWDGTQETIGKVVEFDGRRYEPSAISKSILQALTLPTRCCRHGTTRELLADVCALIANLVGLDEKSAALTGRIVLCSALVDAMSVAPALVIVGPDIERGIRLMTLLRCLCRHSLSLTSVTPAGMCSLPSGARFTYLVSQSTVSASLEKLLEGTSCRDQKIPLRGRLLDLFGVQVIRSNSALFGDFSPQRSTRLSMIPTGNGLPPFDLGAQHQIASEFQAKILSFRRANLRAAERLRFDASKLDFHLRGLAHSLAAATPDDPELQAEIIGLLRDEDTESRSSAWTDLNVIAVEAVLIALHESPEGVKYVSELAHLAQASLMGRGEDVTVDPGAFGKRLKLLGFATEPRDARGKKLRLTEAVRDRARQLARDFGIPEIENGEAATSIPRGNEIDGAAV